MSEPYYSNGINAATGAYLLTPVELDELSKQIVNEPVDDSSLKELKFKYESSTVGHYGVTEGLDPKDLSQAGWGVIFSGEEDPAVINALRPLLDWRRAQAGDCYREYTGAGGFRPGDSKMSWLARHGAGPGPADPSKVPYYLLIAGDPQIIPYRFQIQLDVQYAVGRIHFETPEEYAFYAQSVVEAEKQQLALARKMTFFGVKNWNDPVTQAINNQLVIPLAERLERVQPWDYRLIMNEEARKSRLGNLLGGDETPALLFASAHGVSFPSADPRQVHQQGALLCQDWPGPKQWQQPIPEEFYFSAADLSADARLWGLIAFLYTSYGAGTPVHEEFSLLKQAPAEIVAPKPFLAGLPQKMLAHPRGGALAVLSLVDRAWAGSFYWSKASRQQMVYESVLRRLMDGHPVGSAFEYLNQSYAELSVDLITEIEDIQFGMQVNPVELVGKWAANNDARNFTVLGDPAVRLMVAVEDEASDRERLLDLKPVEVRPGAVRMGVLPISSEPAFIQQLRSADRSEVVGAAKEAVEVAKKSAEVSERLLGEGAQPDPEEQATIEAKKLLSMEITNLVQKVEKGRRKEREQALFVLEQLGPVARSEAIPILKELVLKDPDESMRPLCVRTIVAVDNSEEDLADELRALLKDPNAEVRREALEGVLALKKLQKILKPAIVSDLWDLTSDESLGQRAVAILFETYLQKMSFLSEVLERVVNGKMALPVVQYAVGTQLLSDGVIISEAWIEMENRDINETRESIFQLLFSTMELGSGAERAAAITWLGERTDDLPGELLDRMIKDLKRLAHKGEDWPERLQLEGLIKGLQRRKRAERNLLLEELRSNDLATQVEAIKRAAESEDEWALRILIQEWVQWIAFGQSDVTQLVEEVAEKIRNNPRAVLPLVNQISQEFQPTKEDIGRATLMLSEKPKSKVEAAPVPAAVPQVEHAGGNGAGDGNGSQGSQPLPGVLVEEAAGVLPLFQLRRALEAQIELELDGISAREWSIQQKILKRLLETPNIKEMSEDNRRKFILTCLNEEFKACELKVHRRVARQLADMSNPFFFDESYSDPRHKEIVANMKKYAVPVLARILPEAANDEIRKDLAFTLGNIGGREAVDALARAVVGEERTRANRQALLAEYYLDPSKARSEEAAVLLQEAVKDAKRTLWLQQGLNIAVFVVGMFILVGGLLVALGSDDSATRVAGILAGIGGFGGVILQLINNPLDRIQNAMANLVQLETAFTSFIWELNLNGTYIQSQYVAEGILDDDDISQTIRRIEDAMNLTLDQVAVYTDRGRQITVPHIVRLSPVVGKAGSVVQIYGRHLRRLSSLDGKSETNIAVAINHVPVARADLDKKREAVHYRLAKEHLPASAGSTLWISLVIDGQETNALPFQLTP